MGKVNMTCRRPRQRRRINSADPQTLEIQYLGIFKTIRICDANLELWWRLTIVCCCWGRTETRLQQKCWMVGCS